MAMRQPMSWVPWAFAGAMALVVAVNGVLVYFAIQSWPGLVVDAPYRRGLVYNRVLAEAERQAALGWNLALAVTPVREPARGASIAVTATDATGAALGGLTLEAILARPLDGGEDVAVRLGMSEPGRYGATVELPRPGQWELHLVATRGADRAESVQRIYVP